MSSSRDRRKTRLGQYMQELRLLHDPTMIPQRAAELALCRRETVTRIENGTRVPSAVLLGSLLNIYHATDEQRAEALRLRNFAAQDTIVVEHAADLRPKYLAFRYDESDAVFERTMDHIVVPGLLQTSGYAAALAHAARRLNPSVGWEGRAAEERQGRQKLLHRSTPLRLHSLIGQAVLHTLVGDTETMIEQLQHLLAVSAQDNVTIQIVPFSAGAWGTMGGSAIILEFDDPEDTGSIYLDYGAGSETAQKEKDVQALTGVFDDTVATAALSPEDSAERIRTALNTLEEQ